MDHYDAFISHARADKEWVHVLAENLRNLGLEVFLDAWEIATGDVLVHEIDRGLRDSEEAVALNLRSLALRLELRVPQVRIDLHWLGRQREALGEERFRELVVESVVEESLEGVLGLLAQDEDAREGDGSS